ncbi:hypothetical protein [Abyssalbus ytuae]|uniref:Uncharacterized protein n=1 Tax=Abyssalbus ytuae TaxID=2926907 RepID=A0A9E6ZY95_9FLAO|nr:hypothetical protein [Abyssalbus ytuae]UOB16101.1 hypothetical protein MQE35_10160 [Abyssalbus ytuae]
MKMVFKKYFFPLYALLLIGFVSLYANSCLKDGSYFSTNTVSSIHANYSNIDQHFKSSLINSLTSDTQYRVFIEIVDTEEQEEREESHVFGNHYLSGSAYLATSFNFSPFTSFSFRLSEVSGRNKLFHFITSLKTYIRFQVFRI